MIEINKSLLTNNGQKIVLRSPRMQDLDELLRYANELSSEDTFSILSGEEVTREEEEAYLKHILHETEVVNRTHILAFNGTTLVANAELRRITKSRKRALHVGEVSISVAKDWRGKGIGKIILQTLIEAGIQMGLKLITLTCFSTNKGAQKLYQQMGFQNAGEIPEAIFYKNEYIGQVCMYLPLKYKI